MTLTSECTSSLPSLAPTPSLVSLFDSICATDGDNAAFFMSSAAGQARASSPLNVGLTELRESSVAIASELCHRHGIGCSRAAADCSTSINREDQLGGGEKKDESSPKLDNGEIFLPPSVLIVSGYPSAGEAAAVLACTRLRVPFVPVDLVGPNRVGMRRLRNLLDDVRCKVAIVVVDETAEKKRESTAVAGDDGGVIGDTSAKKDEEEEEDEYRTSPGLQTTALGELDQHPAVKLLERAKVYRHVMISARDGTVLIGLGLSDLALPTPIVEETNKSLRDPLYVLYTSGSTSSDTAHDRKQQQRTGKAVGQTHGGLLNRMLWQWETFPFLQQIRRDVGPVEANRLLDADGISARNDIVVRRTPLSFVDSIVEIFAPLLAGVPLWCPSPDLLRREGLAGIVEEAGRAGATRITCLPSQLAQMLRFGSEEKQGWAWKSLNVAMVSGEPCPPSLPSLWERTVCDSSSPASKLLINLYGQTESSADVLCAVVSTGGRKVVDRSVRFPKALSYVFLTENGAAPTGGEWWCPSKMGTPEVTESLARCLKWTVPCGVPINRHNLSIGPPLKEAEGSAVGRLHISGPGLALGYLNRRDENIKSFMNIEGVRWFYTADLAYCNSDSGVFYILGRADGNENAYEDNRDSSLENDLPRLTSSAVVGKINGVVIHTAEVESVYKLALSKALKERMGDGAADRSLEDTLGVASALHNLVSHATSEEKNGDAQIGGERRLSVFVDLSSFPASLRRMLKSPHGAYIGNEAAYRLLSPGEALAPPFENILLESKALLLGHKRDQVLDADDFVCHPALVPHSIHLLSHFPTAGAAGKINRSELLKLAENQRRAERRKSNDGHCNVMQSLVWNVYNEVLGFCLGVDSTSTVNKKKHTFAELGGDSMMAIECAHKLNVIIRGKLAQTSCAAHVSAEDIMEYSLEELCTVISGNKVNHIIGAKTQVKRSDPMNKGVDPLRKLGGPIMYGKERQRASPERALKVLVAWKCPLLMCVDAQPLLINHPAFGDLVFIGSQGGDILCCRAGSGEVLHRQLLSGKIEGGMKTIEIDGGDACSSRTLIFVCTYLANGKNDDLGNIYAFELSRKRKHKDYDGILSLLWTTQVTGQLKGAPACLELAPEGKVQAAQSTTYGVLVGGYDGVLRYYDAVTGKLIANCKDLGGALHASPTIFKQKDGSTCALVASSTWTGRLTCINLESASMKKLWFVDFWAPIYASPTVCARNDGESVAIFGAIDGAVRCINLDQGSELWKTFTRNSKPIFSACALINKANNIVVGSHDGSLTCICIETGAVQWVFEGNGGSAVLGTPAVIEGSVATIVVGSTSGDVNCLVSKNGHVLKCTPQSLDGEIFSSPVAVDDASSVFLGARDSFLYKILI